MARGDDPQTTTVDMADRYRSRSDQRSMADIVDDETAEAEGRGYRKGRTDALSSVSRGSSRIRPPAGVGQLGDSRNPASGGSTRTVRIQSAPIFAPMLVELGVITTRSIVRDKRAPLPSELGAATFIFSLLALPSGDWGDVALMTAWGLVLATIYGTIAAQPTLPGRVGNAIAGQTTAKPPAATKPARTLSTRPGTRQ